MADEFINYRIFDKDVLDELLECSGGETYESESDGLKLKKVHSKLTGRRRWMCDYEMVFQDLKTCVFYRISYELPSTESSGPYEPFVGNTKAIEVEPYPVTITKYRAKTMEVTRVTE